jgi:hypothetical protein
VVFPVSAAVIAAFVIKTAVKRGAYPICRNHRPVSKMFWSLGGVFDHKGCIGQPS